MIFAGRVLVLNFFCLLTGNCGKVLYIYGFRDAAFKAFLHSSEKGIEINEYI